MKQIVLTALWAGLACAGSVAAQDNPLNLQVPADRIHYGASPASPSSAEAPGAYYGDHSNRSSEVAANGGGVPPPDRKTHISGSVSTGFYAGSRGMGSGMWNSAQLNLSKPVGDHTLINVSIGISKMNSFGGRPGWGGY